MDKSSVQAKFSANHTTGLCLVVGCGLPIGATVIDLLRHGLPFSIASVLAVHTTQPLHWVIDSIPFVLFVFVQLLTRTQRSTAARTNSTGESPNSNISKLTQTVTDLKAELTKQRRTEETLRASEEFYRTLVENTNDGLATISLDGTITSVNRGFELMLGRSRENIVGKHYSTILSISSLALIEDRIRRFQAGEKLSSLFEFELLHQQGTTILVEARVRAITDKSGVPIGFQGVYRDTTKRSALKPKNTASHVSLQTVETPMASGAITGSAEAATLPWMRSSSHVETKGPDHFPAGYSPLSQNASPSDVPSLSHFNTSHALTSSAHETSTFESSTHTSAVLSSESSAALFGNNTSPTQFSFAHPPTDPAVAQSLPPHSTAAILPSQPSPALDRHRKDDRQGKVVPFPTAQMPGSSPMFPPQLGSPASQQMLNLDEALNRVDGDRELLREMAGVFLEEYPLLLVTMQDALSHGNAQTLTYAVHTLKGSVANFAATNAFEAALRLEKIGRQGNLVQAKSALAELEAELARLAPLLTTLKMEAAA